MKRAQPVPGAVTPLVVAIVVVGVFGSLCAVGLITRDRYNFRIRAPQVELELTPAGDLPAPKQLAGGHEAN